MPSKRDLDCFCDRLGITPKFKGIIHVGANYCHEFAFYRASTNRLLLFEPLPECCEALRRTTILQNAPMTIKLMETALGQSPQSNVILNVASNHGASSSILKPTGHLKEYPNIKYDSTIEIEVSTLDIYFETTSDTSILYDTLIIDTEGYDLNVLKGAVKTLEAGHIKYIMVEAYEREIYENNGSVKKIDQFLINHKYINRMTLGTTHGWSNVFYEKSLE